MKLQEKSIQNTVGPFCRFENSLVSYYKTQEEYYGIFNELYTNYDLTKTSENLPDASEPESEVEDICGAGTELVDGICELIKTEEKGGGCLIATAAYGSELAPQVQLLREIRDNNLLNTKSGTAFMNTFNDIYYSFSPTVADWERESPMFKEAVKLAITPMIYTLSLMENANSESDVIGIGISLIILNLGMYFVAPVIVIHIIRKNYRNSFT